MTLIRKKSQSPQAHGGSSRIQRVQGNRERGLCAELGATTTMKANW